MLLESFNMIDRVEHLDLEHNTIECYASVPDSSEILGGHFPGFPIMPGVILTETIAQASGYLSYFTNKQEQMPFLVGIDQARFKGFVRPGEILHISVSKYNQTLSIEQYEGTISVNEQVVCSARVKLRSMDFPSQKLRHHMLDRTRFIGLEAIN